MFQNDLPVANPTSCAFGGKGLKRLFITTAYDGMSHKAFSEAPLSGSVFYVDLTVQGLEQKAEMAAEIGPSVFAK